MPPSSPAEPVDPSASANTSLKSTQVAQLLAALVFVSFAGYFIFLCFRPQWGGDFQMYCAGLSRLYTDLLTPGHEAIAAPTSQSTMYTPYLVVIAVLGKLFGLSPFAALQAAGVANVLGVVASIGFLYSRVSLHKRWSLPAACGLLSMLLLHWFHIGWSSAFSITNFQYLQTYPSTFGWSLALVCFGLLEDLRRHRRPRDVCLLSVLLATLLLNHLLTASWVVGIVGLFGLATGFSERSVKPLWWALAAIGAALLPLVFWPYTEFFGQSGLMSVKENAPFGGLPWKEFPSTYAVGVLCFAFLFWRCRRHGFWFLAMLATLAALGLWNVLGIGYGDRFALFAPFFAHFAAGEVMAMAIFAWLKLPTGLLALSSTALRAKPIARIDRWLPAMVLGLVCLSWLAGPLGKHAFQSRDWGRLESPAALWQRSSQRDAYYRRFEPLRAFLQRHDLVLTPPTRDVFDLAGTMGVDVIACPNAHRIPDRIERARDVNQFFHPKTLASRRAAIAQKNGATHVLLPRSHFRLLPVLTKAYGVPLVRNQDWALWRQPRSVRKLL